MKTTLKKTTFHLILGVIFVLLLLSSNWSNLSAGVVVKGSYEKISVSEAKDLIENEPNLFILDVRADYEFEAGHIEGAYLIPVDKIEDRQDELPNNKSRPILVYCKSGSRSRTASTTLDALSYTQVNNMDGGFEVWKEKDYPYETGPFIVPTSTPTEESSSDGLTSSSETPSVGTPAFEILLVIISLGILIIRSKKQQ